MIPMLAALPARVAVRSILRRPLKAGLPVSRARAPLLGKRDSGRRATIAIDSRRARWRMVAVGIIPAVKGAVEISHRLALHGCSTTDSRHIARFYPIKIFGRLSGGEGLPKVVGRTITKGIVAASHKRTMAHIF